MKSTWHLFRELSVPPSRWSAKELEAEIPPCWGQIVSRSMRPATTSLPDLHIAVFLRRHRWKQCHLDQNLLRCFQ